MWTMRHGKKWVKFSDYADYVDYHRIVHEPEPAVKFKDKSHYTNFMFRFGKCANRYLVVGPHILNNDFCFIDAIVDGSYDFVFYQKGVHLSGGRGRLLEDYILETIQDTNCVGPKPVDRNKYIGYTILNP